MFWIWQEVMFPMYCLKNESCMICIWVAQEKCIIHIAVLQSKWDVHMTECVNVLCCNSDHLLNPVLCYKQIFGVLQKECVVFPPVQNNDPLSFLFCSCHFHTGCRSRSRSKTGFNWLGHNSEPTSPPALCTSDTRPVSRSMCLETWEEIVLFRDSNQTKMDF